MLQTHITTSGVLVRTDELKNNPSLLLPALVSGIYGLLLVAVTLFKSKLSLGGVWNTEAHQQRSLDLVLFNGFENAPVWWGPWVNTFGNIALFLPFGFLLYQFLRSRSKFPIVEVALFASVLSLTIELIQWTFAIGYTDVDDLLFNTLGGLMGAWISARIPNAKRVNVIIAAGSLLFLGTIVCSTLGIL